ncbi:MAG: MerR family DNA-binding transcriptional regulator [Aristaeellaceae bacterium]
MTIIQVCRRYGLPPDTLRCCGKVGVIPEVQRPESGIRNDDGAAAGWAEKAVHAQRRGSGGGHHCVCGALSGRRYAPAGKAMLRLMDERNTGIRSGEEEGCMMRDCSPASAS